jgi:hypothetical protein
VKQSPLLHFESTAFVIRAGEDERTNPKLYGEALATWLAGELRGRDLDAGEVFAEDFGWCIPVAVGEKGVQVVCANQDERTDRWQVFCFVERGFMAALLGRKDDTDALTTVFTVVKDCLGNAPEVRGLAAET